LPERAKILKSFTEIGFSRLEAAIKDLTEEQLDYKICPEATTIRWILTHLAAVLHVYFPKTLTGNKDYKPEGWPDDYTGNPSYSLEKILGDLETGKTKLFENIENLDTMALDKELDWFFGVKTREYYFMLGISEIHHHEGQISAILGVEKRLNGLG
jgi:uncharacterized damage-inducible protein DinB